MTEPLPAPPIVTFTATYGSLTLFPGIFPVKVGEPPKSFDVQPFWYERLTDHARGIDIDVTDCTTFRVTHLDSIAPTRMTRSTALSLLDDSLLAISECLLWFKKDGLGSAIPHSRQVGRIDVKFFSIAGPLISQAAWVTPSFFRPPVRFQNLFPTIRMENGPASSPIPPDTRRFLAAVDLWNLGFFTEAFVTVFALLDDVVQQVLMAGLASRGLSESQANELMRAIKESRLVTFLTSFMELAGWVNLEKSDPALFRAIRHANSDRNQIMHGSLRMTGQKALVHLSTVASALAVLAGNPFGVSVSEPPPIQLVEPKVEIFTQDALRARRGRRGSSPRLTEEPPEPPS